MRMRLAEISQFCKCAFWGKSPGVFFFSEGLEFVIFCLPKSPLSQSSPEQGKVFATREEFAFNISLRECLSVSNDLRANKGQVCLLNEVLGHFLKILTH